MHRHGRVASIWLLRLLLLALAILTFARGVSAMGQPHFMIGGVPANPGGNPSWNEKRLSATNVEPVL